MRWSVKERLRQALHEAAGIRPPVAILLRFQCPDCGGYQIPLSPSVQQHNDGCAGVARANAINALLDMVSVSKKRRAIKTLRVKKGKQ